MPTIKAKQLTNRCEHRDDGSRLHLVIWETPEPVPPCRHHFKYRLAYVIDGVCVVRYDNERGKGDHRHLGDTEQPYDFTTPERLIADFRADVARWRQ